MSRSAVNTRRTAAVLLSASLVALGATACKVDSGDTASSSSTSDSSSKDKSSSSDAGKKASPKAEKKKESSVDSFKDYVKKNGTAKEAAAAKHVTKIQGGDDPNNILDTADVYTDFTGGLAGEGSDPSQLIVSSFKDWEKDRGQSSKNGLVTVYDSNGDMITNGNY